MQYNKTLLGSVALLALFTGNLARADDAVMAMESTEQAMESTEQAMDASDEAMDTGANDEVYGPSDAGSFVFIDEASEPVYGPSDDGALVIEDAVDLAPSGNGSNVCNVIGAKPAYCD